VLTEVPRMNTKIRSGTENPDPNHVRVSERRSEKRRDVSNVLSQKNEIMWRYVMLGPIFSSLSMKWMNFCHSQELDTYSRSASSRGGSVPPLRSNIEGASGLYLDRSRPYRTDSLSVRAVGHSPPSASLEDICNDETRDVVYGIMFLIRCHPFK
jgi:hypothetical protein